MRRISNGPRLFCRHSHVGSAAITIPKEPAIDLSLVRPPPSLTSSANPVLRNATLLRVTGPAGACSVSIPSFMAVTENTEKRQISLTIQDRKDKTQRSMWGLTRALVANAVNGTAHGHTNKINLVGVGYRMALETSPFQHLSLKLGYSTPVVEPIPSEITVKVSSSTECTVTGPDKAQVGHFCSRVRRHRPPEKYNAKGVFVNGEVVKKKEVKKK